MAMYHYLALGLVLAVVFSGCAQNAGLATLPAPQGPTIICSDSDGGKEAYTAGFVSGPCADCQLKDTIGGNTDTCLSSTELIEFYCAESGFARETVKCPNGCADGRCSN